MVKKLIFRSFIWLGIILLILLIVISILYINKPCYINNIYIVTDNEGYDHDSKSARVTLLQEILTNYKITPKGKAPFRNPYSYPELLESLKGLVDEEVIKELQKQYIKDTYGRFDFHAWLDTRTYTAIDEKGSYLIWIDLRTKPKPPMYWLN